MTCHNQLLENDETLRNTPPYNYNANDNMLAVPYTNQLCAWRDNMRAAQPGRSAWRISRKRIEFSALSCDSHNTAMDEIRKEMVQGISELLFVCAICILLKDLDHVAARIPTRLPTFNGLSALSKMIVALSERSG